MNKKRSEDSKCKNFFKKYYGYILLLILAIFLICIPLFKSNPVLGRGLLFICLGMSGIILTYSEPDFWLYNALNSMDLAVLGKEGFKWMLYILFIILALVGIIYVILD